MRGLKGVLDLMFTLLDRLLIARKADPILYVLSNGNFKLGKHLRIPTPKSF